MVLLCKRITLTNPVWFIRQLNLWHLRDPNESRNCSEKQARGSWWFSIARLLRCRLLLFSKCSCVAQYYRWYCNYLHTFWRWQIVKVCYFWRLRLQRANMTLLIAVLNIHEFLGKAWQRLLLHWHRCILTRLGALSSLRVIPRTLPFTALWWTIFI